MLSIALAACAARAPVETARTPPGLHPVDRSRTATVADESHAGGLAASSRAFVEPSNVSSQEPSAAPPDVTHRETPLERLRAVTPEGMNLVLITIDTLRWDLHHAGNPRELSPRLDGLAARSVEFTRGYALSSYTGRSLGPLLIGRYPSECPNNNQHFTAYYYRNVFLAERLRAAGFFTVGGSAHSYLGTHGSLTQGMEVWDHTAHPSDDTDLHIVDHAIATAVLARFHARPAGRRFFLWVHFVDPHNQYMSHPGIHAFGPRPRDRYDTEVLATDSEVGRILDALDRQHLRNRTVVVVTADHGELFHEHGISGHGRELWEDLVRVPFMVYVPGLAALRSSQPRSHIDLVPTLLDLLRIPQPPAGELQGRSLAPELLGDAVRDRPVLMDLPQGPANGPRRALLQHGWKLVLSGDRHDQLYHVDDDPGELQNLIEQEPSRTEELRETLSELTRHFAGQWATPRR